MFNYLRLIDKVLAEGSHRVSRAGPTLAIFSQTLKFDLTIGFPAVTVKKLYFNSVAEELAGFLRAETDASKMGSKIWEKDAKRWSGGTDMGRIYGVQWRQWDDRIDQLATVIEALKITPYDRRHLVSAWNPSDLHLMCLPPCHYAFQFFVKEPYLNCMAHMRSVDVILGLPFDIASYALLLSIVANEVSRKPGELTLTLGDTHIYENHLEVANLLLQRNPLPLPTLSLDPTATIDNFKADMAQLINYKHHPAIKAKLNVGD